MQAAALQQRPEYALSYFQAPEYTLLYTFSDGIAFRGLGRHKPLLMRSRLAPWRLGAQSAEAHQGCCMISGMVTRLAGSGVSMRFKEVPAVLAHALGLLVVGRHRCGGTAAAAVPGCCSCHRPALQTATPLQQQSFKFMITTWHCKSTHEKGIGIATVHFRSAL